MREVLLVGPAPPPMGGVAAHVLELRRALAAHGVDARTVDPRRDGPDGRWRLAAALAGACARGALVHVHTNGHNRMSWTLAALSSTPSRLGRPCLLTLHSGLAPAYIDGHRSIARGVCAGYTVVIAVNAAIAESLMRAGVEASRIVVAPAFTDASLAFRLSPPGFAALRRRHPLLLAAAIVAGAPEYGGDVLLDAFARVRAAEPAAALIVFGPGTRAPAFLDEVRRRAIGNVLCLGELDRARALAVMSAADAFLRPTRADGDAISVREAVALGTPVVASAVGCRPAEARLFPAGDAAACAEMIFHTVGKRAERRVPTTATGADCLPILFEIYARCGVSLEVATTGTAIATDVAWERRPCAALPAE